MLNIIARDLSDSMWEFTSVTSGLAGAGCFRAQIKSYVAWMNTSVDDIFGILYFGGKKSTISEIISALVLGI